jgi:uncharacterized membrane protein
VEWIAALVALFFCLFGRARWPAIGVAAILAILAADTWWLLPMLDARVESIMRGRWPAPSFLHHVYIGLDVAKLMLLAGVCVAARPASHASD